MRRECHEWHIQVCKSRFSLNAILINMIFQTAYLVLKKRAALLRTIQISDVLYRRFVVFQEPGQVTRDNFSLVSSKLIYISGSYRRVMIAELSICRDSGESAKNIKVKNMKSTPHYICQCSHVSEKGKKYLNSNIRIMTCAFIQLSFIAAPLNLLVMTYAAVKLFPRVTERFIKNVWLFVNI